MRGANRTQVRTEYPVDGARIKALCKESGTTIYELSRKISPKGSESIIKNWVAKPIRPAKKLVLLASAFLGCEYDYLVHAPDGTEEITIFPSWETKKQPMDEANAELKRKLDRFTGIIDMLTEADKKVRDLQENSVVELNVEHILQRVSSLETEMKAANELLRSIDNTMNNLALICEMKIGKARP